MTDEISNGIVSGITLASGAAITVGSGFSACGVISTPVPYAWNPIPDITTYELAQCIPAIMTMDAYQREVFVNNLPEEARRHFKAYR